MPQIQGVTSEQNPTPDNNEALRNYENYKKQQQAINTSDNYSYSNNENPAYRGETIQPQVTARQILAQRDQNQIVTRPPSSTITPREEKSIQVSSMGGASSKMASVLIENKPVTYSKGTQEFNKQEEQTLSFLSEAKKQGITNLDVFNEQGTKVGTVNPQDITKARYDILKLNLQEKGPVTIKGEAISSQTQTITQTEPTYKEDQASLFFRPVLQMGASIGLPLVEAITKGKIAEPPLFAYLEGKTSNPITPIYTAGVNEKVEQTFGTGQEAQKIISGQYSKEQTAFGILGIASSVAIPIIAGTGGGIKNFISEKIAMLYAQKSASKVASGLQEGSLASKLSKPVNEQGQVIKTSKTYEFSQGTEDKSGISSYTVKQAPEFLSRTGPEEIITQKNPDLPSTQEKIVPAGQAKVETIKPELPSYLKSTTEVTGIGPKGEPIKVTKPTEVKINPEAEGQANKPMSFIGEKSVAVVRKEPQNILPVEGFLVTDVTPGEAVHMGLEPVPGLKNTYFGKANPHNVEKISQAIESKNLATGTDIFYHSKEDFVKHPEVYSSITDNPEILKGGAYPEITRPAVLRTLEGNKPGGYELKIAKTKKIDITKPKKPSTPLDLSNIPIGKVNAGASGRATSLLRETTKNINLKTEAKPTTEPKTSNISLQRYSNKNIETEYSVVAFPPTTKSSLKQQIILDISERTNTKSSLSLEEIQKNVSETIQINKGEIKTGNRQINLNMQGNKEIIDTQIGLITSTSQQQTTSQITKQTTKEITTTIPGIPERPTNKNFRMPEFNLFTEKKKKTTIPPKGKIKKIFFSWNVNTEVVGGYLPGKELRVGKTAKVIRQTERLQRKVNRGPVKRRVKLSKAEKIEKQTYSKLDKSIYKQPKKQKGFFK